MTMTIQGAIDCLSDKAECRYCKFDGPDCRQRAIDLAVQNLKEKQKTAKEIQKYADSITYERDDYLAGKKVGALVALRIVQGDMGEVKP